MSLLEFCRFASDGESTESADDARDSAAQAGSYSSRNGHRYADHVFLSDFFLKSKLSRGRHRFNLYVVT